MFYEYALEPSVISNWERARYFLDAFGPWKGRFLSEYPGRWKRMVYCSLVECGPVEKKRIEQKLAGLDSRAFCRRHGATYDTEIDWLTNAENEHRREPFRAIIASSGGGGSHVLNADDVDDSHELWRVDAGRLLPREPSAFATAVGLLLRRSRRIVIIDPYFRAHQPDKMRTIATLCGSAGATPEGIEVHAMDGDISYSYFASETRRAAPKALPCGLRVSFHCWSGDSEADRLHNRYILTDIGGVQFGDGIERGVPGHKDRLSILSEAERAELMSQYCGDPPSFDSAGAPIEIEGNASE